MFRKLYCGDNYPTPMFYRSTVYINGLDLWVLICAWYHHGQRMVISRSIWREIPVQIECHWCAMLLIISAWPTLRASIAFGHRSWPRISPHLCSSNRSRWLERGEWTIPLYPLDLTRHVDEYSNHAFFASLYCWFWLMFSYTTCWSSIH
jgi:hypothetical protein